MKSLANSLEILTLLLSLVFISVISANLNIKSFATTGLVPDPASSNAQGESSSRSTSARSYSYDPQAGLESVIMLGTPVLFLPALLLTLMYLIWGGSYSSYNYHHKYPQGFSFSGIGTTGGHYGGGRPTFAQNQHGPHGPPQHGGSGHGPHGEFSKRMAQMDNDGITTHLLSSI